MAKRLAHIDTWRDVGSISMEEKEKEPKMAWAAFERRIAELEARGVAKDRMKASNGASSSSNGFASS